MSLKQELKKYLQTRYNKLDQRKEKDEDAIQEINNIAARFEIKLK